MQTDQRSSDSSSLLTQRVAFKLSTPSAPNGTRSRYVISRRTTGAFVFELRAHNGGALLVAEQDAADPDICEEAIERIRTLVMLDDSIEVQRSLTGRWFFRVIDGARVLARSRPFEYRSRMSKALYAARACAGGSRVVIERA
jgi:hypothetical protein